MLSCTHLVPLPLMTSIAKLVTLTRDLILTTKFCGSVAPSNMIKIQTMDYGYTSLCCPKNSKEGKLTAILSAEHNEFPHMAKLRLPEECGGTIYNKRFIITAAHCVESIYSCSLSCGIYDGHHWIQLSGE